MGGKQIDSHITVNTVNSANTARKLLYWYIWRRKGYNRTTNENKKVSAVISPLVPVSHAIVNK